MDSDDELPCIKFSCSNNVPSEQKNSEEIVVTELSNGAYDGTTVAGSSDLLTCTDSTDVVLLDSDSADSDPSPEFTSKYSQSLRERCNATEVLSSAEYVSTFIDTCDLQSGVDSALVTDSQSCCNSLAGDGSAAFRSYENSEVLVLKELSQETASDMNSQTSSVQSDDVKRRKRPLKADDPEAVARKAAQQQEKEMRQKEKEQKKLQREEEKRQRELAKQEMMFEKTKKRMLQETLRNAKPGECMKHIVVLIDSRLVSESCGASILTCLNTVGVRYEVGDQMLPYMISFSREQAVVKESEAKKLETKYEECVENDVLLYLPVMEFLKLVDNFQKEKEGSTLTTSDSISLPDFVRRKKCDLGGRNVTFLVQGIDSYFRQQKTEVRKAYRSRVMAIDDDGKHGVATAKQKKRSNDDDVSVSMLTVEEALLAVQLDNGSCVRFVETDVDLAKMVLQYTKAVAERPYKRSRMQTTGFSMFVDGGRGTRVGTDGSGLKNVWRQQLMQFKNVSVEVSNAIMAHYPSPLLLRDAFTSCKSDKDAERLLENIEVRRGAGVMATVRRVGRELSRRLYTLMTSTDPQLIIR